VYIGDPVDDLILSLQQWHAQKSVLLDMFYGHPVTPQDRQARYEQELSDAVPTEFDEPYPLWLTLRLIRPLEVTATRGAVTGWIAEDAEAVMAALGKFEDEGNRYLDGVVARLLGSIWPMNLGQLRYPGRQAFLTAQGRAALRTHEIKVTIKDSSVWTDRAGGWKNAPTAAIIDTVRALPSGGSFSSRIAGPAQWFNAALAEEDDLRRFVFAFAGLELLATQAEKHSRGELVQRITEADSSLPVKELLWPSTDEDRVTRNLVFRFAAMASVYSPTTAVADVEACRALARTRNHLFHGAEDGDVGDQSIQCKELLGRYLSLVGAAEVS
jgi:hypothetical protein